MTTANLALDRRKR